MNGIEYLQFELEAGVCIFTIPSLVQSKGYYLDDWKQMIWEGGIRVVDQNNAQHVIFKSSKGEFARFTIPKNYNEAIQKTNDSSRGCAMRLTKPNNQGYLWIGVAFRDRSDCFNFIQAVSEYQEKKDRELNPNKYQNEFKVQDFTLNEKIVFTDKGAKAVQGNQQNKPQADLKNFTFGDNPNNNQRSQPIQQQQQQRPQQQQNNNFGDFGDFSNFGSGNNNNNNNNNNKGGNFGDFSDFSNFGNSNNQQQQQQQQNNNFGFGGNNNNGNNNFGNNNNNFSNNNQFQQQQQQQNTFQQQNNNNNQGQSQVSDNLLDL